ncbi:Arylsulfatase [Planctomycetes bacterium Poly30]|uniref:Arylsulfatase n=1 Tax=Saltatorellus ferox TaxID=2528018 RepID=A0A518ELY2_9BACT|nr:Arylsulfatase [Planctomycetes bacterium Poly30]
MPSEPRGQRPNLLVLFPDQFRAQAQGHRGQDPVHTPNIDRLAAEGTDCVRAYSNSPICSPARAMWQTGRYPFSNGVISNCHSGHARYGIYLKESERCLSDVLSDVGYEVGYIGKWHLDAPTEPFVSAPEAWDGHVWDAFTPPGPKRHGHAFWYSYGGFNDHLRPHYWRDDREDRVEFQGWSARHETDVAIDFLRNPGGTQRDAARPFALTLSWNPPHPPHDQVPEEYLEHYRHCTPRELLRNPNVEGAASPAEIARACASVQGYFGAITGIDDQVGRLLACLREEGLEENTLVVFASDHGEMMGSHGRMQKGSFHEESTGIPFLVRQPGRIPAGRRCEVLLGMPDVMPTLLGLLGLGAEIPASVEGQDLSPALLGEPHGGPEALLYLNAMPALNSIVDWVHAGAIDSLEFNSARLRALDAEPEQAAHLVALMAGHPTGSRAVRSTTHTYVISRTPGQPEVRQLHCRATDPAELGNSLETEPEAAAHHHELLLALLEKTGDPWAHSPLESPVSFRKSRNPTAAPPTRRRSAASPSR